MDSSCLTPKILVKFQRDHPNRGAKYRTVLGKICDSWKPIYVGVKSQKSRSQRQCRFSDRTQYCRCCVREPRWVFPGVFLHSCECRLLIVVSSTRRSTLGDSVFPVTVARSRTHSLPSDLNTASFRHFGSGLKSTFLSFLHILLASERLQSLLFNLFRCPEVFSPTSR